MRAIILLLSLCGCAGRMPTRAPQPDVSAVAPSVQKFRLAWDWPECDGERLAWCEFWGARAVIEWANNARGPWRVIASCAPDVRQTNVLVPYVPVGFFRIGVILSSGN